MKKQTSSPLVSPGGRAQPDRITCKQCVLSQQLVKWSYRSLVTSRPTRPAPRGVGRLVTRLEPSYVRRQVGNIALSGLASVPGLSPLRDLLRAFNCAGEGNIENGARGRPGMKHHVPIDALGRARPVASTANMYTLASVRLLSFWLTAIYM